MGQEGQFAMGTLRILVLAIDKSMATLVRVVRTNDNQYWGP